MLIEVVPARVLNLLYVYIDTVFLLAFLAVLVLTKLYIALIVGLLGGVLYFAVDYGIFYHLLHTQQVGGADPLWFLLWLSMSCGITNMAWIWLWLDHDGRRLEWSVFIIAGWLCMALLSQNFGAGFPEISILRGTDSYHGVMALLLFIGYALLCIRNIRGRVGVHSAHHRHPPRRRAAAHCQHAARDEHGAAVSLSDPPRRVAPTARGPVPRRPACRPLGHGAHRIVTFRSVWR